MYTKLQNIRDTRAVEQTGGSSKNIIINMDFFEEKLRFSSFIICHCSGLFGGRKKETEQNMQRNRVRVMSYRKKKIEAKADATARYFPLKN